MSSRVAAQEKAEADKARKWLEDTLGLEVGEDFFVTLGDGVLLCSIINTIKPGTIPKVNPAGRAKKLPPKRMENINNFILGARKLGMLKSQLFELPEFLEKKRPDRLVKCVLCLADLAKKHGIDRSAASNVLADAAKLDEADAKKFAEAEAREAARIKEEEERYKAIAEQLRKDREAGKMSEEEAKRKQEAAKKEKEERDRVAAAKYAEEKEERERKAKQEAIRRASEAERKAAAADRGSPTPNRFDAGPARTLYGVDAIMYWLQSSTQGYEGVNVQDFTKSWKDGLAFCALIHRHAPKELDFAAMKGKTPAERLEIAFETAGRLGAPPLLDPEDVWDIDTPERRSMITYFGVLYKAFGPK